MSTPFNAVTGGAPPPVAESANIGRLINYATHDVQPGAPIYVQPEDLLMVGITSDASLGFQMPVLYRMLRPDGTIINVQSTANVGLFGSMVFTGIKLIEGMLLSVSIGSTALSAAPGRVYGTIAIARPDNVLGPFSAVLASGYMTAFRSVGWPNGPTQSNCDGPGFIRSITGTNPAAGGEIAEVVPNGVRWRLVSFFMKLTTSAVVANRQVRLQITDGTNVVLETAGNFSHTASSVVFYSAGQFGAVGPVDSRPVLIPLPYNLILSPGWAILTSTLNIDAGDDYVSPQYVVEQWTT